MTLPVQYLTHTDAGYVLAPRLALRNFQERNGRCTDF